MHVVLVEPSFPVNQREFARALKGVGATVTGDRRAPEGLPRRGASELAHPLRAGPERLRRKDHDRKSTVASGEASPSTGSKRPSRRTFCPRRESARPAGSPGTSVRTAFLCRDKPAMKEVLRKGGIAVRPVAREWFPRGDTGVRLRRRFSSGGEASRGGGRLRHRAPVDDMEALDRALGSMGYRSGRRARRRGVRRGARGLLRHADHSGRRRPRLHLPLLPERPRGDAHPMDLAPVHR